MGNILILISCSHVKSEENSELFTTQNWKVYKFTSPNCGTIKYLDNRPETYKCPLCEKEFKIEGQTGCFIATCVFENSDAWEISVFEKFRDKLISKTSIGRYLIGHYYKFSPSIVINLGENKFLKGLTREILKKLAVILSKLIPF